MNFSQVKAITIPEGNVNRILSGTTVLWKRRFLPATYQAVEYIESTETEREYIDLGIKGTENTKVDIEFQATGTRFLPFGARLSASARAFAIWSMSGDVGTQLRIGFDNTSGYTGPNTTSDRYHIILSKEGAFVNDTKVWTSNYTSFETPGTLLVFGYRSSGTAMATCKMKLFVLKLWENNRLTRDVVPCYRKSDGVAGLYDLVSDTFFTNSGTGEFVKGPDIQ